MTSPIEPRTASLYHAPGGSAVEPWTAAAIVMAAMATYLVVAMLVPSRFMVLAAQAALAAVPIAGLVLARRAGEPRPRAREVPPAVGIEPAPSLRVRAALGLGRARPRSFLAAVAVGATAWYLNMRIVAALPLPDRHARALAALVDQPSLGAALAMFALVPAVCEEILFRGVLARAVGRRAPLVVAAAISAAVFSAYHLSLVQALPTLTLGFVLGVIAIRADSVLPTIVAHALNNALAIAMSRGELPEIAAWMERHPTAALGGCAAATALGVAIAVRDPARRPRRPTPR